MAFLTCQHLMHSGIGLSKGLSGNKPDILLTLMSLCMLTCSCASGLGMMVRSIVMYAGGCILWRMTSSPSSCPTM